MQISRMSLHKSVVQLDTCNGGHARKLRLYAELSRSALLYTRSLLIHYANFFARGLTLFEISH